jgi:hypothetical protein
MIRRAVRGRLGRRGASGEPAVLEFGPSHEGTVRKGGGSRANASARVAIKGLGNPVANGQGRNTRARDWGTRPLPISHDGTGAAKSGVARRHRRRSTAPGVEVLGKQGIGQP